jgi:hypothetical protein
MGMSTTVPRALEEAIRFTVPWTAAVAVLLPEGLEPPRLERRKVFALPKSGPTGDEDGTATLARLEALRGEKCEYLIVPADSLAWLERPELLESLEKGYRLVLREPCAGAIFALHGSPTEAVGQDGLPLPPSTLQPAPREVVYRAPRVRRLRGQSTGARAALQGRAV